MVMKLNLASLFVAAIVACAIGVCPAGAQDQPATPPVDRPLPWVGPPPAPPTPPGWITSRPIWIEQPDGNDFERYYPSDAWSAGQPGDVTLQCMIGSDGRLNCSVRSENPTGAGFGAAALSIARSFRAAPQLQNGDASANLRFLLPIRFRVAP